MVEDDIEKVSRFHTKLCDEGSSIVKPPKVVVAFL